MNGFDAVVEKLETLTARELRELQYAIKRVLSTRNAVRANGWKVGTKVRFVSSVRPKCLAGRTATVSGFAASGKVYVDLTYPTGRFGKNVRCTASLLEEDR